MRRGAAPFQIPGMRRGSVWKRSVPRCAWFFTLSLTFTHFLSLTHSLSLSLSHSLTLSLSQTHTVTLAHSRWRPQAGTPILMMSQAIRKGLVTQAESHAALSLAAVLAAELNHSSGTPRALSLPLFFSLDLSFSLSLSLSLSLYIYIYIYTYIYVHI